MSANVVGYDHIDALLSFALEESQNPVSYFVNGNRVEITEAKATEIGRTLLTENERSVRCRYPKYPDEELGIGAAKEYTFKQWEGPLAPLAVLNGCDCFDYQACETDDYSESFAHKIVYAIRKRAIRRLPGMENAPGWEFSR